MAVRLGTQLSDWLSAGSLGGSFGSATSGPSGNADDLLIVADPLVTNGLVGDLSDPNQQVDVRKHTTSKEMSVSKWLLLMIPPCGLTMGLLLGILLGVQISLMPQTGFMLSYQEQGLCHYFSNRKHTQKQPHKALIFNRLKTIG